ncbi:cytochrome c3 family protein [Flavivirga jejuensis]|uniref:Cytochrome c3 family protein n=1 Tax=Flavivirga jejuensis TaxID=870487 RepID=A0ABT8WPS3_9FLAO|nr:cytochrome c3 family protein [Flavivirga jejuensis]MDO5975169.1 cytochrome c3 family protein [Flavivirga jejuensis]
MMNRYNLKYIVSAFIMVLGLASCKHHEDEYHSITDKIEAEGKNYQGTSISSEAYIGDIKTIEITEGAHTFLIPERKSQIKSYACTECHIKPLAKMQNKDFKKAHWDIKIEHANENTMNCITCHNGSNMDELTSLTGKSIDFNKSYNLCNQCHTKQFQDWKGGAHGKRIGGWAPPRASMTCVNCHNPHDPHFESRWPARFNTQKVKERE